ncbi:transmembrane protease serine 2-like [Sphaeramia orbicularis]|uniref:transmembrane protease serine 2-like n=1 Tax=Sphaeramia orbicularis TaxID=375764 RepID=UPI001180A9B1|nr:transmembrane protease serine 2-like [Sphaeramia orbicularis]
MATNPYVNFSPHLIHEDFERRPPSRSDVRPQYVHHLAPKPEPPPPPEITDSITKRKDVKHRCVKFTVAAVICLLLLLLVTGVLLGYYFSSSCVHGLQCGDGSCVWESQWCDGVSDCRGGQDEANCVRLHGSSFLLQIYSTQSKTWRTVCAQGWTDVQGRASCQQIGYSKNTYFESDQQQTDPDAGFLTVKSDFNTEASILKQLVLSNTCPNNSVVTLRCTDCGSGLNSSRALGAQQAAPGSWPWQVSLQVDGSHRCGGAIISPYWIVTAAHCVVRDSSPGNWVVYAGIVGDLDTLFNPAYSVSRIIAHEDYNTHTHRNDIALMRLLNPLDITASGTVRPVCLPSVGLNFTAGQKCWTTHFVQNITEDSLHLVEAEVSLIDASECNRSTAYDGRITQDMVCAEETEADICRTDSGGPLVSLTDGLWWLVGDSIWGRSCTEQSKPGVYGNITYFMDWIYQQMKKHQDG